MADEFDLSGSLEGGFDADPEIIPNRQPNANVPAPPVPPIKSQELSDIEPSPTSSIEVQTQRERTRGKFALYYIVGFMIIVVLGLLVSFFLLYLDKLEFENVTNMLVTISGILSGPLGFIIGYYFKAESND